MLCMSIFWLSNAFITVENRATVISHISKCSARPDSDPVSVMCLHFAWIFWRWWRTFNENRQRAFKIIVPNARYEQAVARVPATKGPIAIAQQRYIKINCNHKILNVRALFLSPTCAPADSRRKIPARLGAGWEAEGEPRSPFQWCVIS